VAKFFFWGGSLHVMYCKCVMVNTIKGSWVSVYGAYLCLHMCVWAVVWAAGAVSNSSSWGGCYSAVYRTMQRSIPWLRHHHRGRDGKTTELICHSRAITHTHTHTHTYTPASLLCILELMQQTPPEYTHSQGLNEGLW